MHVLVTGATGFIGSHILRHLVAQGVETSAFVRRHSDTGIIADLLPKIHLRYGDVTDKPSVCEAMRGITHVYHCAGKVSISSKRSETVYRVNVDGTKHVAQAALSHGVQRFVYTSSVSAIGITGTTAPATETTAWNLAHFNVPYYHAKHLAESEVLSAVAEGLDAVIVNPSYIFGEGDVHFNAGGLVRDLYRRRIPAYPLGGVCVANVDHVAAAHLAAMQYGRTGERYILGGSNLSYKTLFDLICRITGAPKVFLPITKLIERVILKVSQWKALGITSLANPEILATTQAHLYYDSSKAKRELDLQPTLVEDTLRRTFEWYRSRNLL